jgi:hypothetical protein
MNYRKSLTESEIFSEIRNERLCFPPLVIEEAIPEVRNATSDYPKYVDAIIKARWGERRFEFVAEINSLSTPKIISGAIHQIRGLARSFQVLPLLIVPYLNPDRLAELELQGVSGIDLCGNGVVVVPGELLIYRTGKPNRFPSVGTIKNVYRGTSSIIARLFLVIPELGSVQEALNAIRRRGGEVTLGTVSKVTSSLEDDLIIERKSSPTRKSSRQLRLLQPDALLDKLAENYESPDPVVEFTGKCRLPIPELEDRLRRWEDQAKGKVVRTGESSVNAYAVMAREPVESFYCSNLSKLLEELGTDVSAADRFPNVRFVETNDDVVYFDRRSQCMASPIQVYLELANGDKRQQETATQVRRTILARLERHGLSGEEDHKRWIG